MKLQCILILCICFCSTGLLVGQVPELLGQARSLAYSDPVRAVALTHQYLSTPTLQDSARFAGLRTLGLIQEESGKLDEAQKTYAEAKTLAEKKLGSNEQLKIWADWAILHKKQGKFDTASIYHTRCIERGLVENNLEAVENNYHGLATMYSMMSLFDLSAEAYRNSITIAEKRGNQAGHVLSLQNLANIYRKAQNYPLAYQYGFEALQMADSQKDTFRVASVRNIIGSIYLAEKKTDSAQVWLEEAKAAFTAMQHQQKLSEVLLALSELYLLQGKTDRAELNLIEAGQMQSVFSPYSIAQYAHLQGKLFESQRQKDKALAAYKLSIEKTSPFGFDEIARSNCLQLQQLYHTLGEYDSSFVYAQRAHRLSEKIFNDAKLRHMTEGGQKYQLQNLEKELAVKEAKLQGNQRIKWIMLAGMLVLAALLAWLAYVNRQRNKAVRLSGVLLKELNHRTKNNLQTLVSMMRIQARQINDPTAQAVLNETRNRMEAISLIHQKMYEKFEFREVDMSGFIQELLDKLLFSFAPNHEIKTQLNIEERYIDIDKAIPLALIINELITNSFKHGFKNQQAPAISITLNKNAFSYTDNGSGYDYDETGNIQKNFGLSLIESLTKSVGYDLRFSNSEGATCSFQLRRV